MRHPFTVRNVVIAAIVVLAVAAIVWCNVTLASAAPYTARSNTGVFVVLTALAWFCIVRAVKRWAGLGAWRRIYATVTVGVSSALLVAFIVLVAQDEVFAPKHLFAIWKLERLGGHILVEELRGKAVWVSLGGQDKPQVTDADLVCLEAFPRLYSFRLLDAQVTDAGLEHIRGAAQLHFLCLPFTNVTDNGLLHLQGLTKLVELDLSGTRVTDSGLEHLKNLSELRQLSLRRTRVTEQGIKKLQKALPNCKIER
jgi:hypothetical protein